MIVRSKDARKRKFLGLEIDALAVGEKSMVTRMNYKAGDHVRSHSHSNEQLGYVVSGKIRIRFGEFDETLLVGDSYAIPGGIEHSIDVLEDSVVIDCFSPPRQDYL